MTHASIRRIGIALLALVGVVAACSGGDVAAPANRTAGTAFGRAPLTGDRNGTGPQSPDTSQKGANAVACSPHGEIVGSGVFGPSGGTLTIGNSRLIIPGGALHDTVTITATVGADSASVDFQPEGLQFAKPVGLVLDGSGCVLGNGGDPVNIDYLAPDGTVLETIPAVYDPHWKSVAAPIVHFSRYAIAGNYGIAF